MKATVRNVATYITLRENARELPPIESITIPGAKSVPAGRFVGVYGVQGTLGFFKEVRRRALADCIIRRVNIQVDVGETPANILTTLQRLPDTFAVHLDHLSLDLRKYIMAILNIQEPQTISRVVSYDPAILNELWADAGMAHVRFFCWQHPTSSNPQLQFGAVASPSLVSGIEVQNFPHPAELRLMFL